VKGTGNAGPGVQGSSATGPGVDARSSNSTGLFATGKTYAAYLDGDVMITGTVLDSVTRVRIDHPLQPDDRYLTHAAVQSAEMKNVYDGTAVLDAEGQATVELPDWFEALNGSFRYQLTAIGAAAPDLHIGRPLAGHTFEVAGGHEGLEVSWQITGVRRDGWARTNPLTADQEKPEEEKGYFVHPEVFGQPPERALSAPGGGEAARSPKTRGTGQ
jgi:hypothetical protein